MVLLILLWILWIADSFSPFSLSVSFSFSFSFSLSLLLLSIFLVYSVQQSLPFRLVEWTLKQATHSHVTALIKRNRQKMMKKPAHPQNRNAPSYHTMTKLFRWLSTIQTTTAHYTTHERISNRQKETKRPYKGQWDTETKTLKNYNHKTQRQSPKLPT